MQEPQYNSAPPSLPLPTDSNNQMCADLGPVKGRTLEHEPPTRALPGNVDVCPFAKFAGAYFQASVHVNEREILV